jgi:hypothetical protein
MVQSSPSEHEHRVPKFLFRAFPPLELVEDILRSCGLRGGLSDMRQFKRDDVAAGVATADTWLPLLEPYYLPCKAKRFFHTGKEFTTGCLITVLRHIVRPHGYDVFAQERAYQGVKQTLYQLKPIPTAAGLHGMGIPNPEVTFE